MTPSVTIYLNMLNMILSYSTNLTDRQWALKERHKMLKAGLIQKISDDTYLAVKEAEWD